MKKLLIDIGSTSVKFAESERDGEISEVRKNPFPPKLAVARPFYEVSREEIVYLVKGIIRSSAAEEVYISTQMHGWLLGDKAGKALTEYVSWQDKRAGLRPYGFSLSPEHGVGLKDNLPRAAVRVTQELYPGIEAGAGTFFTLGSYLVYRLTGKNVTHITDAAASGYYNCITCERDKDASLLDLPRAYQGIECAGEYEGKRIYTPVGDQQASVLGAAGTRIAIYSIWVRRGRCAPLRPDLQREITNRGRIFTEKRFVR